MIDVHQGDALTVLRTMPENSVHCIVTSPPYWGLRDYGTPGQLGLEKTPEEYLEKMTAVFREARRVLRPDGTCWVNMGDSYAGYWGEKYAHKPWGEDRTADQSTPPNKMSPDFKASRLKPKDLCMMPARLALALQADGWWLRSEIIWNKPNPMPESVTDRPTKSHEMIYLLTKSGRYFYDAEAVRESGKRAPHGHGCGLKTELSQRRDEGKGNEALDRVWGSFSGRNCRSVWTIATAPYPEAHFATFPPKIPERCILAGTSERGCCPTCGKPWVRVIEKKPSTMNVRVRDIQAGRQAGKSAFNRPITERDREDHGEEQMGRTITTGWRPSCDCGGGPVPCTVLDPFGGSGTTAEVAIRLGRRAILIELKAEYIELTKKRIAPALELARQERIVL